MSETKTQSIFDTPEFSPYANRWNARLNELTRRRNYYDGTVYKKVRKQFGWLWPRLYKGIKPLYLPLSRAVDVDAGIVPGGWALPDGTDEAQPFNPAWQDALNTVFDWSKWDTDGVLYIHYGAEYGVAGLKVADLRLREPGRVVVQAVKPTNFLLIESGDYDTTPAMAICVETKTDKTGTEYEYAEVIEPDLIRTFKDGDPMGFEEREPEYINELGFVPFVEIEHIKTGEAMGEATYQKAIPLLDEANQLGSYLADIIAKHSEPQWAAFGVEASGLTKSGDNIWFFPSQEARLEAVLPKVDLPGILDFVRELRDQVYASLPELSFDELRKKDRIATATLELQLMELVLKIRRCRPNYDHGLAEAIRMAGRAAESMGLPEVAILNDPEFSFNADRPVLPLDPETAMRLEMQAIALEREKAATDRGEGE